MGYNREAHLRVLRACVGCLSAAARSDNVSFAQHLVLTVRVARVITPALCHICRIEYACSSPV